MMTAENSWLDTLLPSLDPVLVETIPLPAWRHIPPDLGHWLINNTLAYPWSNQLAFAAVVHASSGVVHPISTICSVYSLLRYAIPNLYADLASLEPEQALWRYMSNPLEPRVGRSAYTAYIRLQNKTRRYLDEATPTVSERLKPFLLPPLIVSTRLAKLAEQKRVEAIRRRKSQTFDLTENLSTLVALAKRRYQWLANLENQVQQIAEQFRQGQISLPAALTVQHPAQAGELTFRVWDKSSWLKAHQAAYGARVEHRHRHRPDMDIQLFLQLEGHIPEGSWFLPAVAVGVIQGSQQLGPQARHYADQWQLPRLNVSSPGLLTPGAFGRFLWVTRDRATGLPDDSKVIFCVEPLLAAATVGLFVLISIVSTGMRVGELQQVTYDQECMERGYLPQFDDQTKQWIRGPERTFWRVYPKDGQQRERYFVSTTMLETLLALHDLHRRYHGPLRYIVHTAPHARNHWEFTDL